MQPVVEKIFSPNPERKRESESETLGLLIFKINKIYDNDKQVWILRKSIIYGKKITIKDNIGLTNDVSFIN